MNYTGNKRDFSITLLGIAGWLCLSATSMAQYNPVTATPNPVVFNIPSGQQQPVSQTVAIGSGAQTQFTAAAFSNGNWLSVTPTTGTTNKDSITITVNPLAVPGTPSGFVNITTGDGTPNPLQITVQVTGGGSGTGVNFTSTPGSLTFTYQTGTPTTPPGQAITINSANGAAVAFNVSSTSPYVTVSSPTGTTGTPFTVNVNPLGLNPGTYPANLLISAAGYNNLTVPVTITVTATPSVTATPNNLAFAFQVGAAAPPPQYLNVGSTGAALPFTITASTTGGGNWLVVNPVSGSTPATVSVQVNTANLPGGSYQGQILVTSPNSPNMTIPVTLTASTQPLFTLSAAPTFTYQFGGLTPAPQTVQIGSTSGQVAFGVAVAAGTGPVFLQPSTTAGTTPQALSFSLTPGVLASLAPGTYTNTVTLTAPGTTTPPQTFTVTLVVSNTTLLNLSQAAANFNFQLGQANPAPQSIVLTSTGVPLNFTVAATATSCPGFLTATPASGVTTITPNNPATVAIAVNTAGLTAGTCTGNVVITAAGASNSPVTLPVTLTVSATPLLNVSPAVLSVSAPPNTTTLVQQTLSVTSTDPNTSIPFTVTTNLANGSNWLLVNANGATPTNLLVAFNPNGLQPGTYSGTITLTPTTGSIPAVTVPLNLTVTSPNSISATPAGTLTFTQPLGAPQPAAQTVQISTTNAGASFSATAFTYNGGNWLSVTPGNGATPMSLSVAVNTAGLNLGQGTYNGAIAVVVPGAANSPFYIPVMLTIGQPQTLTLSSGTVAFNFTSGSITTPSPQTVQLTSTGGPVPFTVTTSVPGGVANFLTVTPASGTTPGALSIAVNPAGLAPGTYTGTVMVASPNIPGGSQTLNVTFNVTPPAPPAFTAVVNAASQQAGAIAPGEIVTIYGTNIGPSAAQALHINSQGLLDTTLGDTKVFFDNVAAPLIYVSAGQVNAIVPYEVAGRPTVTLHLERSGTSSNQLVLRVVDTAPAIFTLNLSGSGQGAILNQNFSVNGSNNPATRGSVIQIFATGEGVTFPGSVTGSVTGSIPPQVNNVRVTIGGVDARVTYAGEAPSLVAGVLQVNAVVPDNVVTGNVPVVVTVGSNNTSGAVTVAVQ